MSLDAIVQTLVGNPLELILAAMIGCLVIAVWLFYGDPDVMDTIPYVKGGPVYVLYILAGGVLLGLAIIFFAETIPPRLSVLMSWGGEKLELVPASPDLTSTPKPLPRGAVAFASFVPPPWPTYTSTSTSTSTPVFTNTPTSTFAPTETRVPTSTPTFTPILAKTLTPTPTSTPTADLLQCRDSKIRILELGLGNVKTPVEPAKVVEILPSTVDIQVFGSVQDDRYIELEVIWLRLGDPPSNQNWHSIGITKNASSSQGASVPNRMNPVQLGTWDYSARQGLKSGPYYLSIRAWYIQEAPQSTSEQFDLMPNECWITIRIP
jgi:hypothetical protein